MRELQKLKKFGRLVAYFLLHGVENTLKAVDEKFGVLCFPSKKRPNTQCFRSLSNND